MHEHAAAMMNFNLLIKNLTVSYNRKPAVHHLNHTFVSGKLTALIGPNGAGKSTLLKTIAGLIKAESGNFEFENSQKRKIAFLAQQSKFKREEWDLSVKDFILLGQQKNFFPFKKNDNNLFNSAVRTLQLDGLELRNISDLSGGQFQKVLFARLLQQNYDVYLLDEPFTGLDAKSLHELLAFLNHLKSENKMIICVVHDLKIVEKYFDEFLLLARKKLESGSAEALVRYHDVFQQLELEHSESKELCKNELF